MKIDAHQHFWKFNHAEYEWINEDMQVLKQDYLPNNLYPELLKSGFTGSVAVQARQTVEETRWLLRWAEQHDFIKAVVGWVDLCSEKELRKQLDEFTKFPKFAGVRHVVHDEPDDSFMLREDFLKGISNLSDYNLTYDLLLFPRHLQIAEKVVAQFPEQRFALDHLSKPHIKQRIMHPWKEDLEKLALHNNVWCKISGMVTEADWNNYRPQDLYPYLDAIFEIFGTDRLMFGSDWPVCLIVAEHATVTDIVEGYLRNFSALDQHKIMGGNAAKFYNIRI